MTKTTVQSEQTQSELAVIDPANAIDLFVPDAMENIITQVREKVDQHIPDTTTSKGRKEIVSLAFKVASTKVKLDDLGKELVSGWKAQAKKVDEVRKYMRDELDAIRDDARRPLAEYEAEQAEQQRQEELALRYDSDWDEAHAADDLFNRERVVREKEAALDRQEEERRAKAEAARIEGERIEREKRIAQEAAERATREAEEILRREREARERAEREKVEAEARAKVEAEAAVREAERKAREEAERKERERLEAEGKAKKDAERKARNKRHRAKITGEALESALDAGFNAQVATAMLDAILAGKIKHVTINF